MDSNQLSHKATDLQSVPALQTPAFTQNYSINTFMFNLDTELLMEYSPSNWDLNKIVNKELEWLSIDTQELYQKNLILKKLELEKYGWIDRKFTYKFNKYGFRCDNFTQEPSIMFLGCSFTLGTGLPMEDTWSYKTAQSVKLKRVNLGVGGGANDTAFRLANFWLPRILPKIVVFLPTINTRLEVVRETKSDIWSAWLIGSNNKFYYDWVSNDINCRLNYLKNSLAIKQLCTELNIKYVELKETDTIYLDYARDLHHPGIKSNNNLHQKVLSKIE